MKKSLLTAFYALFVTILIQTKSYAQSDPFIPKYDAVKRSERCFTITPDVRNRYGIVWFKDRGDFSKDTTLYFVMYFGENSWGADGFGFVMHDDPRDLNAKGDHGGGMGFAGGSPIKPSVGIEFDTHYNGEYQDGKWGPYQGQDHTALLYNGDKYGGQQPIWGYDANGNYVQNNVLPLLPIAGWGWNKDAEDNNCYAFKINWIVNNDNTQSLELWAENFDPDITDGTGYNYHLVMRHTDKMIDSIFNGVTKLRFGFTGSTGDKRNEQTVCLLGGNTRPDAADDYATTKANTTVVIDVESNDFDLDGDNLFVPVITKAPTHGTATVISVDGSNMIEYTPNAGYEGTDTIKYNTCDVDSDKCYALCDEASVVVEVECDELHIKAEQKAPYTICDDSLTPNGAAQSFFLSGTGRGNFWVETFTGLDGATGDTGDTGWSVSATGCSSGSQISVSKRNGNEKFRAEKTGCEVVWTTDVIDISSVSDVNISMYIQGDEIKDNSYIRVYYKLDGGAETPLTNGSFDGAFASAVATATGLNGSTLQIVVKAKNTDTGEVYWWDDLYLTAVGPLANPSLTYYWYEGGITGDSLGTGTVRNQLKDTTYDVVAIESTTGCRSDTVSVTISNKSKNIPGDSISIVRVQPLTKCEIPYDGELRAGVIESSGDTVTTGYKFEWRKIANYNPTNTPDKSGFLATNLNSEEYRLTVISNATGCTGTRDSSAAYDVDPPVLTAKILSHVYSCKNPNSGKASAVAINIDGDTIKSVKFKWYQGQTADLEKDTAVFIADIVETLKPDQYYTIIAIDTITKCTSNRSTIYIEDFRNDPEPVVTAATDQISCDSSATTGSFTSAVKDGTANVTSGFTFEWYKGLNNVTPAKDGYTGGPDVSGLPAGDYRLIVTNDTSGCFAQLDTAIVEELTYPEEIDTLTTTPVNVCGPSPNGTITVTHPGSESDYSYRVYSGLGVVADSLLKESTSKTISGLDVGNFTVTVVNNTTKCVSPSKSVSIADSTELPKATLTSSPQYSCDSAKPRGKITATVKEKTASDYTFLWFVSDTTGTSVSTTAGVNGEIAEQLSDITYALKLTDNTTQCKNVYFQKVGKSIKNPVIDTAYSVASVNCTPIYNGELLATADGGKTDSDAFTFTWKDSTSAVVSTDAHATGIAPGDYELTLTNDTTFCVAGPYEVTVVDSSVTPNPEIEATNNSSCDVNSPNGKLEVTNVTNQGIFNSSGYSYKWYIGKSDSTQLVIPGVSFPNTSDSSLVSGLSQATYALVITNKGTNCSNEALSSITDINIKPVLDYPSITNATRCTDPYMSVVEITTVNGGEPIPAEYSFRLENAATGDAFISTTGKFEDLTSSDGIVLPPGKQYKIIVLNDFNCPSDTIEFEIKDKSSDPAFSLNTFDNTSCDASQPNGIIVTSTDGSFGVSKIEWFNTNTSGSNVSSANITRDDSVAINLAAGDYAVRLTADNGCNSVEKATIDDNMANDPLIDSVYVKDLTSCVTDNGYVYADIETAEQLPPDLTGYRTYTFYAENSGTSAKHSSTTDPSSNADHVEFNTLSAGDWDIYVVDDYTHCDSDRVEVTLEAAPEIEFNATATPVPGCGDLTGAIDLSVKSPGFNEDPTGDGFTFAWFEGNSTSGASLSSGNVTSGNWTSSATSLTSKYYTVQVMDKRSQCTKDTSIFVTSMGVPDVSVSTVDATQCIPGNGELSVTLTGFPSGKDYDDYKFMVYEGRSFDPSDATYRMVLNPSAGPVEYTDLEEGEYVLVAQEDFGSNCYTDPEVFKIEQDFNLELTPVVSVSDSSCTGGTATGVLDASYNTFSHTVSEVDYEWFSGSTTSVSVYDPAAGDPATFGSLVQGKYTLQLEVTGAGDGLGCVYQKTINLPKARPTQLVHATVVDNFNCTGHNGEISIDSVSLNGAGYSLSNFEEFKIVDEDDNEISVSPYTATTWVSLSPGDYYLSAKKTTTQCYTRTTKFTVDDNSQNLVLNVVMDTADYSCNDINPTGVITASATPVPGVAYSWQWVDSFGNSIVSTDKADTSVASALPDGIYTITVTDNDADGVNEGCSTSRDFTVTQGDISIVTPLVNSTDRTICADNGSIAVSRIEERRNGSVYAFETPVYSDYVSVLYDSDLVAVDTSLFSWAKFQVNSGKFGATDQVPVGTYYVKAQNISTACDFGPPTQVIIRDVSQKPKVNITLENPDYACDVSANHTGILAATVYGGSDNDNTTGNFSYLWTDLAGNPVITDGSAPPRAVNLPDGNYKLQVMDNSGVDQFCVRTTTFEVTRDQQDIVIVASTSTDQTLCRPNGTFQVEELLVTEGTSSKNVDDTGFSNYSFSLYLGNVNPSGVYGPTYNEGTPADPIDSLSANTYYAVATDNETKCESQPLQVNIRDVSQSPIINLTVVSPNYSLNYDNQNSFTGELTAEAFEADGFSIGSGGFDYKWYRNVVDSDSVFASATGVTAIQTQQIMRDADYFVHVMSDSTGCETTTAVNLPFVYLKPQFNPVVTAQTFCSPVNGAIDIPSIYKVADSSETFSKYKFFWHVGDYDVNSPEYVEYGGNGGNTLNNIAANSYYIQALDTFWMVESDPVQVTVSDSTVFPEINLNSSLSDLQTSCNPDKPNGALSVLIGGNVFDTYSYRWFEGSDTTNSDLIGVTETIQNQDAGHYTIKVTSATTGCVSTKTYRIADDIKMPVLTVSFSPVTNCVPTNANGVANANIINIINSTYNFYWYTGQSDSGTPVYTDLSGITDKISSSYQGIPAGFYTVVAQDTFDCKSDPVIVEVEEELKYPRINWEEVSPLTHCDPAKANAVVSATANESVVGYSFLWYVKNGSLYNEGPEVNNLGNETYRLVVADLVTGCSSFEDIKPSVAYLNVPSPMPSVLNNMTSCIEPNGEVTSSIFGQIGNYYFTYLGSKDLDSLTNPRNGAEISGLDFGDYYVFATDRISGCVSDSVLFTIADERYVPDYDVVTEPSSCIEPTGSVEAILSDIILPYEVRWYDENENSLGASDAILFQPAGTYYVAVEGTEGCIDSTQVQIKTGIVIYNGISANNDGLNDVLRIECLDFFPNNNVKIFNRAGQMVFEMNGYDSDDFGRSFNGISNKGLISGSELAIGTYYYMVDIGDGSKPVVGYLELTR